MFSQIPMCFIYYTVIKYVPFVASNLNEKMYYIFIYIYCNNIFLPMTFTST